MDYKFVENHPNINIPKIKVINGLFVNANIDGNPIKNNKDPIPCRSFVFFNNTCLNLKGF